MIDKSLQAKTTKYAAALDEKVLQLMPNGKHASTMAQRQFLGIIAERQAKLEKQIKWLHEQQEYYRQLREDI